MVASRREPPTQSGHNPTGSRQHLKQAPRERTSAKVSADIHGDGRSVRQSSPNLNSK